MPRKKQAITLHKANEMVRGRDRYSVHAKRLLNAIYYVIQYNVNNGKAKIFDKLDYIEIEIPFLRKMMGLQNVESYIKEIEDAFKELQEPIELNNFRDPRNNVVYNWFSMVIIPEAKYTLYPNKKKVEFTLSPFAKWLMINTNKGNFTKLKLIPYLNKLRTKYSMKLYEYLKSFNNYRYLEISQKHLMKILGFEPNHKTYKNYSALNRLLERQIKEIREKTDLKQLKLEDNENKKKELAENKLFKIYINPKAKKKSNEELKDDEDRFFKQLSMLDKIINNYDLDDPDDYEKFSKEIEKIALNSGIEI